MSLKLIPSLLNVGGLLVENYQRSSRATDEAKIAVGILPNQECNAGIGIASVTEYITMFVRDLGKNEIAVFDLSQLEQSVKLDSFYIDSPDADSVLFELYSEDNTKILTQSFGKSQTPISFPSAPLPPTVKIKVKALTDVKYMQLVLVPVVILQAIEGTKEAILLA